MAFGRAKAIVNRKVTLFVFSSFFPPYVLNWSSQDFDVRLKKVILPRDIWIVWKINNDASKVLHKNWMSKTNRKKQQVLLFCRIYFTYIYLYSYLLSFKSFCIRYCIIIIHHILQNDPTRGTINLYFWNQVTISGEFHYDRSRPPAAYTHVSLYYRNNWSNLARLYGGGDRNGQRA